MPIAVNLPSMPRSGRAAPINVNQVPNEQALAALALAIAIGAGSPNLTPREASLLDGAPGISKDLVCAVFGEIEAVDEAVDRFGSLFAAGHGIHH